jgi:hypothetical protein
MSAALLLSAPGGAWPSLVVEVEGAPAGGRRRYSFRTDAMTLDRDIAEPDQNAYLDLFADLAEAFGTRMPESRQTDAEAPANPSLRPLLTTALSPQILYGYGDPSVVRTDDGWRMVVTSNDAPDAFPILSSKDAVDWRPAGFVFPQGRAPAWTLEGHGVADFWAPELHRVGDGWWLCFSARAKDRTLAIGMARAASPDGPFLPDPEPLLGGGVIDPHIVIDEAGRPHLFWKEDDNAIWPRRLSALLARRPEAISILFDTKIDRRTASLTAALWPWIERLEPMEQFFLLQPLIEAAAADFPNFQSRLAALPGDEVAPILHATRTRVFAQPLTADGRGLEGERTLVLQNDLPWEAHLIEGVWVTRQGGRWWMFYAANDFSTPHYGIGAAVADRPTGPYRKLGAPILKSGTKWVGPGHPSVAPGPDGRPWLFLHAFFPGQVGYKAFRAVLSAPLSFDGEAVLFG